MGFLIPDTFEELADRWAAVPPAVETSNDQSERLIKRQLVLGLLGRVTQDGSDVWAVPSGPLADASHTVAFVASASAFSDPERIERLYGLLDVPNPLERLLTNVPVELRAEVVAAIDSSEFSGVMDLDDIERRAEQIVTDLHLRERAAQLELDKGQPFGAL